MEFLHESDMDYNSNSHSNGSVVAACRDLEEMVVLRRGPWTVEEDLVLVNYVNIHGEGRWNSLATCSGLKRTGKSCRLRWLNYLRPDVRRGNITPEEQLLILQLHSRWGNRWSKIARHLPGRTDNEIKNYWRTRVQKQATQLKVDVNSQQFKEIMQYIWVPRLIERIRAKSGTATATTDVEAPPSTMDSMYYDTTTPPPTNPHGIADHEGNNFAQVKLSPESSVDDSFGTTSLVSSPPLSDFTIAGCYNDNGGSYGTSEIDNWVDDMAAAATGFDEINHDFLDLDNGWGCDGIPDNFWDSIDDIWSLQQ